MLKLGLVQMSVMEGRVEENCSKIREIVDKYVNDDIDLLCFPELCISGYDFKKLVSSDYEEKYFSSLAAEKGISVLAGIQTAEGNKHYDAACIWNGQGELIGKYHKIHLWDTENDYFEKGDKLVTVPFKGWNIGLLICADYGFSEVSSRLSLKENADVIIYPSAWAAGWEDLFSACSKIRAAENQVYTVALNRASGDVKYCGNTTVSNPDGSVLCRLCTDGEGYVRVILERKKLEEAREAIPWRSMRRCDLYKKL